MKTVSVLIPTGFKDRRRHEIYLWTTQRWMMLFPDFQICLGTCLDPDDPNKVAGPETYNRSEARNNAFQSADGEILIITDADTATSHQNVLDAVDLVSRTQSWVIAHRTYHSLTQEYTDALLQDRPDVQLRPPFPSHWTMRNKSQAGVLVMPREAYETVEGYDERFNGWGYEDNAFAEKLDKKWSPALRTSGEVVHLWHERGLDFEQPHIKENEALYEEIKAA